MEKRALILDAVGARRLALIEDFGRSREIYRITQLLTISGIGDKTVSRLGDMLGYWFFYAPTIDTCMKTKAC